MHQNDAALQLVLSFETKHQSVLLSLHFVQRDIYETVFFFLTDYTNLCLSICDT